MFNMMRKGATGLAFAKLLGVLVALGFASTPASARQDEAVGQSCADCATADGEFAISNDTGMTIHYFVRWDGHDWHEVVLPSGRVETHRHELDQNNQTPAVWVSFDPAGRVGRGKEYAMEIAKVESGGFSSQGPGPRGRPFPYKFIVHGRFLDLVKG